MTKASRRHHLRTGGNDRCPYCKIENDGLNIEYSGFDPVESGVIENKAKCTACGREWCDVFTLTDVQELA